MTAPNDGNRTPTPMQVHVYTDENGWTSLDPNVPLSQQPLAGTFFSSQVSPNDQSGFRAMYVESSVKSTSDQPQQRGMMITSGMPPMTTHDNQGRPQTPMQTIIYHSNQPFANIPPPPGFENFPPPMTWCPGTLPMPPGFQDNRFGENRTNEFGFPPALPGFHPPTPPIPMPWPTAPNGGPTVITAIHTTTSTAPMDDPRFHPSNPDGSPNTDRNVNNTVSEIQRSSTKPNLLDQNSIDRMRTLGHKWHHRQMNSCGDVHSMQSTPLKQDYNSQNSQQDLSQSTGPI
ncbi:unnamed protein product [Echinostoma caproni]|uniref:Ovule protein n=1 Tax=Echinostoma caproni TaxID=27848 RepID=A0A183A7L1_9TREM|nr:unnamed protein product [Echinostoma caproni]